MVYLQIASSTVIYSADNKQYYDMHTNIKQYLSYILQILNSIMIYPSDNEQ